MQKLLEHSWSKTGFLLWVCTNCGCMKQRVIGTPCQYFFFRSGEQLPELPECKRIMHCDHIS
jgi:hypothetical protein